MPRQWVRKRRDDNEMPNLSHKAAADGRIDPRVVSARLREWRDAAEKSRRDVVIFLDVSERTVVRWEDADDPALPPAHQFLSLVRFYKADVLDLLATKVERRNAASTSAAAAGGAGGRR